MQDIYDITLKVKRYDPEAKNPACLQVVILHPGPLGFRIIPLNL